jgi:hypothetical protein
LRRRSSKANRVARASRRRKEPLPEVPPLFRSDPEDNFRLWVQNCSLDASLARGDAIREWLAKPLETRVHVVRNNRVESSESNASEMPGPAPQEARDGAHSDETNSRNPKGWLGSNSQLLDGSKKNDPFAERFTFGTEHHSKLSLKFAKYAVLGLLIVTALWAIPTSKVASRTDAPIAATQPSKAKPNAAAAVSVPQEHEAITTGPMTIEKLSVGCEVAQPCIEIRTSGKATLPKLSTLGAPDRVVMDFQDTVFPSDVHRITVGRGSVKAVRSEGGATRRARTRVVIDLTEPCRYELQALTNRFVLKFYPKANPRQAG